jgi:hypothetical protein
VAIWRKVRALRSAPPLPLARDRLLDQVGAQGDVVPGFLARLLESPVEPAFPPASADGEARLAVEIVEAPPHGVAGT